MASNTARRAGVLETILEWSQDRPAWQRDALRRIVIKGRLDQADHSELTELCRLGRGEEGVTLAPVPLERSHLPADQNNGEAVTLLSIADVDGVNELAPAQTLTFQGKGLTVIFGNNGAGKSGYARILKRACRARHPGRIEQNI